MHCQVVFSTFVNKLVCAVYGLISLQVLYKINIQCPLCKQSLVEFLEMRQPQQGGRRTDQKLTRIIQRYLPDEFAERQTAVSHLPKFWENSAVKYFMKTAATVLVIHYIIQFHSISPDFFKL